MTFNPFPQHRPKPGPSDLCEARPPVARLGGRRVPRERAEPITLFALIFGVGVPTVVLPRG